jgi:glycine cleavage system H protein
MNTPVELRYTAEHEWVRIEGDEAVVGITDFAQESLGDIVYVSLPEPGDTLTAGQSVAEVESTKSVSEIYTPLAGTVTAVNDALNANPERINEDPYGEGWICEVDLAPGADVSTLLDAAAYGELTAD